MTDLNSREIRPYWKQVAERELGETPEVKTKCLAELRLLLSGKDTLHQVFLREWLLASPLEVACASLLFVDLTGPYVQK